MGRADREHELMRPSDETLPGQPSFLSGGDPHWSAASLRSRAASPCFVDHPALGVGASNFTAVEPDYERRFGLQHTKDGPLPHNLYLRWRPRAASSA